MSHSLDYPDNELRKILTSVRRIALVGASPNPARPSHGVMAFLLRHGYEVLPVTPRPLAEILGQQVSPSLADVGPVDMVEVFRARDALPQIAREAVQIGASVLWGQLGVVNFEAAAFAESAGMKVIMDRCPAIEIPRLGIPPIPA